MVSQQYFLFKNNCPLYNMTYIQKFKIYHFHAHFINRFKPQVILTFQEWKIHSSKPAFISVSINSHEREKKKKLSHKFYYSVMIFKQKGKRTQRKLGPSFIKAVTFLKVFDHHVSTPTHTIPTPTSNTHLEIERREPKLCYQNKPAQCKHSQTCTTEFGNHFLHLQFSIHPALPMH